jgi:hypothetical protein
MVPSKQVAPAGAPTQPITPGIPGDRLELHVHWRARAPPGQYDAV